MYVYVFTCFVHQIEVKDSYHKLLAIAVCQYHGLHLTSTTHSLRHIVPFLLRLTTHVMTSGRTMVARLPHREDDLFVAPLLLSTFLTRHTRMCHEDEDDLADFLLCSEIDDAIFL